MDFVVQKLMVAFGLTLLVAGNAAFADGKAKAKASRNNTKANIKTEATQEPAAAPKSFDRDSTQKLNFEPMQIGSPEDATASQYVDDAKSKAIRDAVAKKQRELDRLMSLLESGRQMLAEAGDNRSAQLKISGSLSLLEVEIQRVKFEIEVLSGGRGTPVGNNSGEGAGIPAGESNSSNGSSSTLGRGIEPAANPESDFKIDSGAASGGGSDAPAGKGNK
ncbi:hypothetical protein EBR21_08785 [bacterium]|nr:hypothetical protein [bacterium]